MFSQKLGVSWLWEGRGRESRKVLRVFTLAIRLVILRVDKIFGVGTGLSAIYMLERYRHITQGYLGIQSVLNQNGDELV